MAPTSMTGFARADGAHEGMSWHWEVRTVNGRGLDVRVRLPQGFEELEKSVRDACARVLRRGNCAVNLSIRREPAALELRINRDVLDQVLVAAKVVGGLTSSRPPSVDGLLAMRGVLELVEPEDAPEKIAARSEAMLASLEEALAQIVAARRAEGARLGEAVGRQLEEIERLTKELEALPANSGEAIMARLREQIARLFEAEPRLDEARLHQEAMLLAAKADITEELARLKSHIAAARELLESDEAVGRRLDFLAQEFNREANTICSKANDVTVTRKGLALKAVIEQMREQVQNIE